MSINPVPSGMEAAVGAFDWARTPLGAMAGWPQSLRTVVRLMLDSRYAMWMAWGPELTFFCNDAYRPTLGAKHDFIGRPASQVWSEIWPDVGPRIDSVLSTGIATYDEGLLLFLERRGFKEETYHTFSYSPVRGDDGQVQGMLCVVTEDTERVLAQRRLTALAAVSAVSMAAHDVGQACQAALQALATVRADVPFSQIYWCDEPGQPPRLMGSFGLDAESLAPRALAECADVVSAGELRVVDALEGILPARCGPWPEPVQRAVILPIGRQGAESRHDGFMVAGLSPRLQVDAAYTRFFSLLGAQVENAITDAQAFDAERRQAEELAELNRAKTTFFSNISHELRTPLTLIASPIEDLLATEDDASRRELLQLTQRNAQRLQRLVNTLLEFARIEAGRVQATFEPVDLAALTRNLASVFRSAMEQAGLDFRVRCEALPQPVFVDRDMWEKVVLNLISNAFKFTLTGSVSVDLSVQGQDVVLAITDTGVGVPAAEMPRLFERFHRVQGVSGRTQEGSGIGLALVQELVRIHGGAVDAISEPGRGSTFRVMLPLGAAHLPADRVDRTGADALPRSTANVYAQEMMGWIAASPAPSPAGAPTEARQDWRFADTFGARIVLADDNRDMRDYVHRLLSPSYAVEAVADGTKALLAARRERPDLVLSDVMMPGLDGFELLKAMRADPALATVPIVLVSARAGEEARIESLDAGADDYLVKPFSARELVARVGAMLERARQIKDREALLESLRLRTVQFESLLNEAPIGVFLLDAQMRVVEVNPMARPAFGDVDPLIGREFGELMHIIWPDDFADDLVRLYRHTLETGEPYAAPESIRQRKDRGTLEFYDWRINRLQLPDGQYGVVCYFRDISEHVKARKKLEDSDRQKDEFLAMLAHELRNPLAPIRSAGEFLTRIGAADPRVAAAADVLRRQVALLSRLVDDLLDVSRITQQRIELSRQTLQLADVVSQAVETTAPLLKEKQHRLAVSSTGVPRVLGDPVRLVQCVVNVIANAVKYTDPGGEIRIASFTEGDEVVIRISDNGAGIAPELLPYVFDLFVQSDRTLDRSQGGLGIGLSLVKRLIGMHGGRVSAASDGPGHGATFEIRLPAGPEAPAEETSAAAHGVRPLTILVVDDNVDAAQSLALVLELDGHRVASVYASSEALEHVLREPPEVVLLDIGLPGMDGYEVARRVRASPVGRRVKLIALTGYGHSEDKQRAMDAGFDDHLVKPIEHAKLAESLGRVAG